MEQQLGFTFYPKDWWTSDTFFLLTPFERYVYLELLFMMYSNDGFVSNNKVMVEGRLRTAITDKVWSKITDLLVEDGDKLTHRSVNKRLARILANRENGKKGGAPKGNSNASKQPKQPNETTQNNPPYKEKEKENRKEKESEESSHAHAHEVVPELPETDAPKPEWYTHTVDELEKVLVGSQIWKESVCMQYRIGPGDVDAWIGKFSGHLKASGEETKTLRDGKKHFSSWLRIQLKNGTAEGGVGKDPALSDPSMPPDNSRKWLWLNGAWRDTSKFTNAEKRRHGIS